MTTTGQRGDWMQTYTGKAFYPLDPSPDEVDAVDIAHALSMLCRYGGHARRFYSVAEHCVLMSWAVPEQDALHALLHDATEAYVGDMVRPLKRSMPQYGEVEERVGSAIARHFGLPDLSLPRSVREADNRILLTERAVVMGRPPQSWGPVEDMEPLPVTIRCWPPEQAWDAYRTRLEQLLALKADQVAEEVREAVPIAGCCVDIDGDEWHDPQRCRQARSRSGLPPLARRP